MATFIKLSRKNGGSLSVNVDQLASFEEAYSSGKEFCILRMCGDSIFVDETHDYIESLILQDAIEGWNKRAKNTCDDCSRLGDEDYCWSCSRHFPDMYEPKEVE